MIVRSFLLAALLSSGQPTATDEVMFDGVAYTFASSARNGDVTLVEFVHPGQSLENWSKLVSIQCHPSTRRVADVINPYLQARKTVIAAEPEFVRNSASADDDLSMIAFLGRPGMPHLEFVLARFVMAKDGGAVVFAYSQRFPMSRNVKVDVNRSRLLEQMAAMDAEQAVASCALQEGADALQATDDHLREE